MSNERTGIIVEYKDRNLIRIINPVQCNPEPVVPEYIVHPTFSSEQRSKSKKTKFRLLMTVKSWKETTVAQRNWSRHLCRLSPSARVLNECRCIYPETTLFVNLKRR
jgi:hypothetical protein